MNGPKLNPEYKILLLAAEAIKDILIGARSKSIQNSIEMRKGIPDEIKQGKQEGSIKIFETGPTKLKKYFPERSKFIMPVQRTRYTPFKNDIRES